MAKKTGTDEAFELLDQVNKVLGIGAKGSNKRRQSPPELPDLPGFELPLKRLSESIRRLSLAELIKVSAAVDKQLEKHRRTRAPKAATPVARVIEDVKQLSLIELMNVREIIGACLKAAAGAGRVKEQASTRRGAKKTR